MTDAMIKIGILQAGHVPEELAERHGDYASMLQRLLKGNGFEFTTWNAVDGQIPYSSDQADGWLVTGSKFSTFENRSWIRRLEQFLQRCYALESPIVGICFGHQLLAKSLGGVVTRAEQGWVVGRHYYDTQCGLVFLNAWHQDQVVQIPADAEVIGTSDFCKFAMLAYGRNALSIQAHPEFNDQFLRDLIESRGVGLVPNDRLAKARSNLGKPVDPHPITEAIVSFFAKSSASG